MKKLFGVTFEQLHNNTTEELHHILVDFTIDVVKKTAPEGLPEMLRTHGHDETYFYDVLNETFTKFAQETFDENYYRSMRLLYDTEERFNIGSDLAVNFEESMLKLQILIQEIFEKILS